ncbi:protocatechuate 3,4-dioxygenase subunit alpha [uncultured Roseobacter sp.]|uniref:protocatechuate 3,4-dioxygenase subunit alpha n=1 Tax=uncultured Roseobacter sp. TaxID=114847 RepID=UPI0026191EDA|nr:protocatechuate 3,4-dioxygenase subunit alpha [uncultured Roseobacter sp.]
MTEFRESPSQTAGPYVHIGCMPGVAGIQGMYGDTDPGSEMVQTVCADPVISLEVGVLDGAGAPVCDAMIEIWQAGPEGSFGVTRGFCNWGRAATDAATGVATFETLRPGAIGSQAPHILVWIVARGINLGLMTRIYFDDAPETNARDEVFKIAGDRAGTLVARSVSGGFRHTIRLQGPDETVFFDV